SPFVQALPSLQLVPSGALGLVQAPVAGLHAPATWHWSEAVQRIAVPGVQAPAWQVSFCVQASPSSQAAPSGLTGVSGPLGVVPSPTASAWHGSAATRQTVPWAFGA